MNRSILLFLFLIPVSLFGQQHPIPVESAMLLEPGQASAEFGFSHFRDQPYPLSGLTGNLTKIGTVRFCIALSEFVELQAEGTLLDILHITRRVPAFNSALTTAKKVTADIGDFTVWTKFGILNEYRSGINFAVRFGMQLPNASNESGLGIDEMNFFASLLLQKHFAGRWTMNAGLGILSDPTRLGSQHDVFIYGVEYFLPFGETTSFLLQTAGRVGHNGIGFQRLANGKIGFEKTIGPFSVRAFGVTNFSPADNAKGAELTLTYLFHFIQIGTSP
ncbi:MAG: hypothetical protein ACYC09_11770 [Bacteroidota bacterium]